MTTKIFMSDVKFVKPQKGTNYQASYLKLKLNTTNSQSLKKLCSVLKMDIIWSKEQRNGRGRRKGKSLNSCPCIVNLVSINMAINLMLQMILTHLNKLTVQSQHVHICVRRYTGTYMHCTCTLQQKSFLNSTVSLWISYG